MIGIISGLPFIVTTASIIKYQLRHILICDGVDLSLHERFVYCQNVLTDSK